VVTIPASNSGVQSYTSWPENEPFSVSVLKGMVFWDVIVCSMIDFYQIFGGTSILRVDPKDGGSMFLRNIGMNPPCMMASLPEASNLNIQCCENLEFYIGCFLVLLVLPCVGMTY
jgi:hypothetical protein